MDLIERQAAIDAVRKCSVKEVTPAFMLVDKAEVMTELMMLPSAQLELATDCISKQSAIDAITDENIIRNMDSVMDSEIYRAKRSIHRIIASIPSAQPEWNNHTVACLLAELFDDACACNYNGIDEWLPSKCELLDSCPNPVGVACWEQYLKHREERRTDEGD